MILPTYLLQPPGQRITGPRGRHVVSTAVDPPSN